MNAPDLTARLQALNDNQLKQLLGRMMLELDPDTPPMLDAAEIEERSAGDRGLVKDAADSLGLSVPDSSGGAASEAMAKQFLIAVSQISPQHARIMEDAMTEVEAAGPKLDFGLSLFAMNAVVLAITAAIVRPSIDYESSRHAKDTKTKFAFKLEGVKDISAVIKTVFPFLK